MPVGQHFNCLFNKTQPIPIKQTIDAVDKLLDLIAENEVEITEQDMQAYNQGELGDIITHYRLEGNLPKMFDNIERKSIDVAEKLPPPPSIV